MLLQCPSLIISISYYFKSWRLFALLIFFLVHFALYFKSFFFSFLRIKKWASIPICVIKHEFYVIFYSSFLIFMVTHHWRKTIIYSSPCSYILWKHKLRLVERQRITMPYLGMKSSLEIMDTKFKNIRHQSIMMVW